MESFDKLKKQKTDILNKVARRYRLVKDDDGHYYVIPAELEPVFVNWVYATSSDIEWYGEDFEKYSLGGSPSYVTFTDPKWGLDGVSLSK